MTYNLPIPAGAVAGDWYDVGGCGYPGDVSRMLTWSQHNVWRVHVAVVRAQSSALQTGFWLVTRRSGKPAWATSIPVPRTKVCALKKRVNRVNCVDVSPRPGATSIGGVNDQHVGFGPAGDFGRDRSQQPPGDAAHSDIADDQQVGMDLFS
jgi:hypothetical protein